LSRVLVKGFYVVLGLLTFTVSAKENTKEKKKRDVFVVVFFKTKARLIAYIFVKYGFDWVKLLNYIIDTNLFDKRHSLCEF